MNRKSWSVRPDQIERLEILKNALPVSVFKAEKSKYAPERTNYELVDVMIAATCEKYPQAAAVMAAVDAG